MFRIFLVLAIFTAALPAVAIDYTKATPQVELRAIWINADAIPKTEQGIRDLVNTYHKANLNVLLPEVVSRGYTAYPSKLLARDPRFQGAVDPLPAMIDEAHKLGMEVHPWVWVFRAGYTKDRGAILTTHPDWVERSKYGEDLSANGGLWVSPAIPAARDFLASLYRELATNYKVDGIHLDYIRYEVQSPTPYGYSDYSRKQYKMLYGVDPVNIDRLTYQQNLWNTFRERQVSSFVQRVSSELRSIRPGIVISAAVGSDITSARLNLLQNWGNWIENKWVDFLTPMTYTANDLSFTNLVMGQRDIVNSKAILAPGIGLHMQQAAPDQTARQIGIARQLSTLGQALFASAYYAAPQEAVLAAGPYAQPAAVPYRSPATKAGMLTEQAQAAVKAGDSESATFYTNLANVLGDYAKFKATATKYVFPTPSPVEIPETVVPLPTAQVPKATGPITVDGSTDDAAWTNATRVELAYTNQGDPAPIKTTALLTYDATNIYIAFQATEPQMPRLKATVDKRDGPTFYDDSVEIFVDPTNARRQYYHLSTNTLGARFDQKVFTPSWNSEWSTASKLGPQGYTTEIAIPFASLGAPTPAAGTAWAINLTRNRLTTGLPQYFTWAVPYGSFHSPDRLGTIVFQ